LVFYSVGIALKSNGKNRSGRWIKEWNHVVQTILIGSKARPGTRFSSRGIGYRRPPEELLLLLMTFHNNT
jgi:hypothetical protein